MQEFHVWFNSPRIYIIGKNDRDLFSIIFYSQW